VARERSDEIEYGRPVRRILLAVLVVALLGLFLIWRIDSPRVERLRAEIVDRVVPALDWVMAPVTQVARMAEDFRSYARIYEQNQELRRELKRMKAWKEAALQLEQENARLLDLNKVKLSPSLTFVTGVVMADSGSPFRRSVLLNVGRRDGIQDGWAAMDGLGLVGRISGVGTTTSRVILLTDPSSRVPVTVQPSGQRAMVVGDNTGLPRLAFVEDADDVRAGDRIVTSGDAGVFPPDLLVGQVVRGQDGTLRVLLAADYGRLEFLRVLRSAPAERIESPGSLIVPEPVGPLTAEAEGGDG